MSRRSAVGSVPIADRIKAFDNGASATKPGKISPSPPPKSSITSKVFNTFPKSQYSAKDPTRPPLVNNPPIRSNSRTSLGSISSIGNDEQDFSDAQTMNLCTNSVQSTPKAAKDLRPESKTRIAADIKSVENQQNGVPSSSNQFPANGNAYQKSVLDKSSNGVRDFVYKRSIGRGVAEANGSDTVDRSKPLRGIIEVCQENNLPDIEPLTIGNNRVSVNNNKNTLASANSNISSNNNSSNGKHEFADSGIGKTHSISSDSEDLPSFSSSVTDEGDLKGVSRIRKDIDTRVVDSDEQVEELVQQVDMLMSAKARLQAELTQCKKDHKREVADKDDELEDTRASAAKKIKILEQQLELEHEERLAFLRERHELEGKIMALKDALDHGSSEDQVRKLKKDLKRSKALLKDAQLMLDKNSQDGINKIVLRQLKNQLEDAEFARTAALKGRANAELELVEINSMLEDVSKVKTELEEKVVKVGREKADLAQQLKENEEEMAELMKKYKAAVSACSVDQITIQDQAVTIQQLETERNRARELLAEMEVKVEHCKGEQVSVAQHRRLELRLREMDSKLELEKTGKGRLEVQVARLKEVIEKLTKEGEALRGREKASGDEIKKINKVNRDLKEELSSYQGRDVDVGQKKLDMEKMLEVAEAETLLARNELKVALRRIEDLQAAIQGDMDTSAGDSDGESDGEGLGETEVWLEQARRRMGSNSGGRRSSQSQHNSLSLTGHNSLTDLADKSFSTVSSIDGRELEPSS